LVEPYLPTPKECASLILRVIESREQERKKRVSRARFAELTLKRLWGRQRLSLEFVAEVQQWLLLRGWVFMFAGSTYAVIRSSIVESWVRLSSKRIAEEVNAVRNGEFDFGHHRHLWLVDETDLSDEPADAAEPD
jgi:hypothetical protein